MRRRFATLLLLSLCQLPLLKAQPLEASVLSSGNFYQVEVSQSGMFKITAGLLAQMGVAAASVDPGHVRVWGGQPGMLPQANAQPRVTDLQEIPVLVSGEGDGNFSNNDYVLFYAVGPDLMQFEATGGSFHYSKNLYSDHNYYFIQIDQSPSKRLSSRESLPTDAAPITAFDEILHHEKDEVNLLDRYPGNGGSGRRWFGEIFDFQTEYTIGFSATEGLINSEPVRVSVGVVGNADQDSRFLVSLNGSVIDTLSIPIVPKTDYGIKGRVVEKSKPVPATGFTAGQPLSVRLAYSKPNSTAFGYLDFVTVRFRRGLRLYGNQTRFRSVESLAAPVAKYRLQGVNGQAVVLDVTDPLSPIRQQVSLTGSNAEFGAPSEALREFVVFQGSDFPQPKVVGKVANQNLHGMPTPNLLIVTDPAWQSEAQRLADFRMNHDGLTAQVVTTQQIYNEFSSGRQDVVAIRDFIRLLYQQDHHAIRGLRYVLLFGDASFDYKTRLSGNTNHVPVYESEESLHPIYSFSSDDYFTFMDEAEGDWRETSEQVTHTMDLGIGRLPVSTTQEAREVVDKLIYYGSSQETLTEWRKRLVFVADDGDLNTHQLQADQLANFVEDNYPLANVSRVFVDAYPQETSPATGRRVSPLVREKIDEFVTKKGALVVNYSGHGAETGWASENILGAGQILEWRNRRNLPLFVTATCEFGRYDDPALRSGAELALLSPTGGAIALLTTTRPVFSSTNFLLNKAFYNALFEPIYGELPRLGDILRLTKNNSIQGVVNRNFALLGDPSMRLAYPMEEIQVTGLRNAQGDSIGTFRALDRVTLRGEVRFLGEKSTSFNGEVTITVFDKPEQLSTLGDEGPGTEMTFRSQESRLFHGKATVEAGAFEVSFVVPKDIDYTVGAGKISLYARHQTDLRDAAGYDIEKKIGGSALTFAADSQPPVMKVYLDDERFVSGGKVGPNPLLLLHLEDESGITTTGKGLGHDLLAYLDGQEQDPILLNNYYQAEKGSYKKGKVVYPLSNLTPGRHTLTAKAWDTHNNSVENTIVFWVTESGMMLLEDLQNSPNPFNRSTIISFRHNRAGENLDIEVHIFDASGKMVKEIRSAIPESTVNVEAVEWDRTNTDGMRVPNGMYIYRIFVTSELGSQASKSGRMIVAGD